MHCRSSSSTHLQHRSGEGTLNVCSVDGSKQENKIAALLADVKAGYFYIRTISGYLVLCVKHFLKPNSFQFYIFS